jgi:hypothetical protein
VTRGEMVAARLLGYKRRERNMSQRTVGIAMNRLLGDKDLRFRFALDRSKRSAASMRMAWD